MAKQREYVLSIAGFDPCAGAGVLADIKTFESHKVYGHGVTSAITFQHESEFAGLQWIPLYTIKQQIDLLFSKYKINWVKVGLIENFDILEQLVDILITYNPKVKIIVDPVLKASATKELLSIPHVDVLERTLRKLYLITPNYDEIKHLYPTLEPSEAAQKMALSCHVFLKGGHRVDKLGYDTLFVEGGIKSYSYKPKLLIKYDKHGSGCVLSSSILANLAQGFPLPKACLRAKRYIEGFFSSSPTLLGFHKK